MSNIILIDSSYTSFHRFFATMRWFSLAHMDTYKKYKDDITYDWSQQPEFIEKYKKMYLESIINLISKNVYMDSIVIFCLDSPQVTLWRHEFSDCYKGNRIDMSKKTNFIPTFKYTYNTLIPGLVRNNSNFHMICIPKMEADDLIALSVRFIKYKRPSKYIYIVSGDNDFLQLGFDKLYFADYKKKDILTLTRQEAKEALRLKLINGDCSDNIPSIFPKSIKINNKRRKLIREDKKELIKYLSEYSEATSIYNNNKQLIDFKYIPKKLRQPIYKIIRKIIK